MDNVKPDCSRKQSHAYDLPAPSHVMAAYRNAAKPEQYIGRRLRVFRIKALNVGDEAPQPAHQRQKIEEGKFSMSVRLTLRLRRQEDGLVEAVAETDGGLDAAAKIAGDNHVVADGSVGQRDATGSQQSDAHDAVIEAKDGSGVEVDVRGVFNVAALPAWRRLLASA
jgi:hypothetical protein